MYICIASSACKRGLLSFENKFFVQLYLLFTGTCMDYKFRTVVTSVYITKRLSKNQFLRKKSYKIYKKMANFKKKLLMVFLCQDRYCWPLNSWSLYRDLKLSFLVILILFDIYKDWTRPA